MGDPQQQGLGAKLPAALLREWAHEANFELCGFARAEPIDPRVLRDWLEAGMAADMDWMGARAAERLDVSTLLPGAKSVVALACNYYVSDEPSPIARFARGRDYHATLKDRLRVFRRKLSEAFPSLGTYGSVDSGPLMEKIWAVRAGLGYVGKNGCLITERYGSYVVLAALILDQEMDEYSQEPAADRCGSCSACVSACPTVAIHEGGVVDARRCLSYQTIENRGPVPLEHRAAFAELAFGCDICQEVCPLNGAPLAAGERFFPRPLASLTVLELAAMTPEQYQALIPGSALARAKYDGLRRNAAYALGAAKVRSARACLEQLSRDPSSLVREAAAWALSRLDEGG